MISNSKQNWGIGQAVKVGFMTLTVVAAVPTPGDFAPDAYLLSRNGTFYQFVPHNGLQKLEIFEARELVAAAAYQARLVADAELKRSRDLYDNVALMNEVIFADWISEKAVSA